LPERIQGWTLSHEAVLLPGDSRANESVNAVIQSGGAGSDEVLPVDVPQARSAEIAKNVQEIYEEDEAEEDASSQRSSALPREVVLQNPVSSNVPYWNELPLDLRGRLPSLRISLYAYAVSTDERFVVINGKKIRQGGDVSPGVKVLQIGAEAMMMEMQGQKFMVPR
jgi:hypothetical protein